MEEPLIRVNSVWKRLCRAPKNSLRYAMADMALEVIGRPIGCKLRQGEFWALQDVNLEIKAGEVLGLIGHNGAGKSTLINIIAGLILPTIGSVEFKTRRVALMDQTGGFNMMETGRENVHSILAQYCFPIESLHQETEAIRAYAGIGDFFDAPVGSYSLGMKLRLAFSVYTRIKPDLFLVDEAIGGGDIEFQNRFRSYLRSYIDNGGSMLFCSHQLIDINILCDRCLLLDRGSVVSVGDPVSIIDRYLQVGELQTARGSGANLMSASRWDREKTGLVELEACKFESVNMIGEDNGVIRPGKRMVIEMIISVEKEIEGIALAIDIGCSEIVAIASIMAGYPDNPLTLKPPFTKIKCCIGHLPLAAGSYSVSLVLSQHRSGVIIAWRGYVDAPILLEVANIPSAVSNLARRKRNLVHIDADWAIVNETDNKEIFGIY